LFSHNLIKRERGKP